MKRLALSLALLLALCVPAWADTKIAGETKVAANHIVRLRAEGAPDGAAYLWDVGPEDVADVEEAGDRLFFAAPPGVYKVRLTVVTSGTGGKLKVERVRATVTVGEPGPVPPGPTPPVPPGPTPGPAPIPADGLHVLVVLESADLSKLPAAQRYGLESADVYAYLNAKCPKGPDGKTAEWRVWDQNVNPSAESALWQDAFKRPRASVPWIIVSNPRNGGGYEGPLPKDRDGILNLLKQYGEPKGVKREEK